MKPDWPGKTYRSLMLKPILVFGATGQVGREIMRRSGKFPRPLIGLTRAEIDIRDNEAVSATIARLSPGLVINCAAYTAVDKAETEQDIAFSVNRDAPAHLAKACFAQSIPLLHMSTDYVFDGRKPQPYLENDRVAPLGIYGASKLAGEIAVREQLPSHVILRTAWVFAAHGTNFVRTILRLSAERPALRIVADQHGGPTSAAAIADAMVAIALRIDTGRMAWGTYHFCGAPATTWFDFAAAILREAVKHGHRTVPIEPITTADYPTPAARPANSVLACARIKGALGIEQPDWRRDLANVVADLLSTHPTP
jgi:dTDP-4-dehydrorhamnose reductase